MDPNLVDMFSFPVSQAYFDPSFDSAEFQKVPNFPSMPATPPSVPTHSESQVPTGSAASGPSVPSAPSSAFGSPYSGDIQAFQDNWVNTNHGLRLPAAVMNDLFFNDFAGGVDMDGMFHEKFPNTFVGRSIASFLFTREGCQLTTFRSIPDPAIAKWFQFHAHHLIPRAITPSIGRATQFSVEFTSRLAYSLRQGGAATIAAAPSRSSAIATVDSQCSLPTGLGIRPTVVDFLRSVSSLPTQSCLEQCRRR